MKDLHVGKVLLFGAGLGLVVVGFITGAKHSHELGCGLVGAGVILLGVTVAGAFSSCPECHTWFERELINSVLLDKRRSFETVTRYDIHRDRNGNETGRTERQEQIVVIRSKHRDDYTCKMCCHEWSEIRQSVE